MGIIHVLNVVKTYVILLMIISLKIDDLNYCIVVKMTSTSKLTDKELYVKLLNKENLKSTEKTKRMRRHIDATFDMTAKRKCPNDILSIDNTKKVIIKKEFKNTDVIFKNLCNVKQPEQKSKEWFAMRDNIISASDIGTILDVNKHAQPIDVLKRKLGYELYTPTTHTEHGIRYERIAQMIYSHLFNTKVRQFGLIISQKNKFLGASPDGINDKYTLDDKFNELYGRMIEIKCPLTRKIMSFDKINIPIYYLYQVQLQLEVCDLEECDFVQCSISEISRDELLFHDYNEETVSILCMEESEPQKKTYKKLNKNISRGIIIENTENQNIYPPSLDMSINDYLKWFQENAKEKTYFRCWILNDMNITTIKRDRNWFKTNLPQMKEFHKKLMYYKKNREEFEKIIKSSEFVNKKSILESIMDKIDF